MYIHTDTHIHEHSLILYTYIIQQMYTKLLRWGQHSKTNHQTKPSLKGLSLLNKRANTAHSYSSSVHRKIDFKLNWLNKNVNEIYKGKWCAKQIRREGQPYSCKKKKNIFHFVFSSAELNCKLSALYNQQMNQEPKWLPSALSLQDGAACFKPQPSFLNGHTK